VSIKLKTPFAVVLLTSLDQKKSIKESKHVFVTTMARAENTGIKYNVKKTELIEVGNSPFLLEPLVVELSFGDLKIKETNVLDYWK